jgi:chromatin assembly factor 1 subunit B
LKIPVKFFKKEDPDSPMKDATNIDLPTFNAPPQTPAKLKTVRMYHDESLLSFFRRPAFSPDGNLLLTPTAQLPVSDVSHSGDAAEKEEVQFGVLLYSRGSLLK